MRTLTRDGNGYGPRCLTRLISATNGSGSNDSGGFEAIENATGQTYTLGDEDVGREVQVIGQLHRRWRHGREP